MWDSAKNAEGGQDSRPTWKSWSEPWKARTSRRKCVPSKSLYDRNLSRVGLCEECVHSLQGRWTADTRGKTVLRSAHLTCLLQNSSPAPDHSPLLGCVQRHERRAAFLPLGKGLPQDSRSYPMTCVPPFLNWPLTWAVLDIIVGRGLLWFCHSINNDTEAFI